MWSMDNDNRNFEIDMATLDMLSFVEGNYVVNRMTLFVCALIVGTHFRDSVAGVIGVVVGFIAFSHLFYFMRNKRLRMWKSMMERLRKETSDV